METEHVPIAPCPCGATPDVLFLTESGSSKYGYVSGICCGEWCVEFYTTYKPITSEACYELALAEWNRVPRGGSGSGSRHPVRLMKTIYTNCFFWAMWQWMTKGGYLVIRKARAGWFWHFLWKPTENSPMFHFRSHTPIRFPWPIQRGRIVLADNEEPD